MRWIFITMLFAILFVTSCAYLDEMLLEEEGGVIGGMASVARPIAQIAKNFLPPWLQLPVTILTGVLGIGAAHTERKRRIHKKARIDYGNVIEILKNLSPEILEKVKAEFMDRDKGSKERTAFYERYIEDSSLKNKTEAM